MIEATDMTFDQEVMASSTPVLVDFYADWCQPCKLLSPILTRLAAEYDGKIKFVKVNTETGMEKAKLYSVSSIPALFIFKDGQVVRQMNGLRPEADIKAALEEVLF